MSHYRLKIALHRHPGVPCADGTPPTDLPHQHDIICSVDGSDLDIFRAVNIASGRRCIIVGNLFDRATMEAILPDAGGSALMHSGDAISRLLQYCWGRYVALVVDDDARSIELFRDPGGQLPCYWSMSEGYLHVSSDVRGLSVGTCTIDWPAVRQHLAFLSHRTPETCIEGVQEVAPGMAITFRGKSWTRLLRWKPITDAVSFGETTEALAARLRFLVEACVAAWAKRFKRPLVTLSGGLDSSMIAAALRHDPARITCLNIVSGTGRGDESKFARSVAQMHGLSLKVAVTAPDGVDLRISSASGKPRPAARAFTQETDRLNAVAADEAGCDALFNGGGGDNVFAYLHSSYPATDALLDAPLSGAYRATVRNLSVLTGCDLWTIAGRSLRNILQASKLPAPKPDHDFLKLGGLPMSVPHHPWMGAFDMPRPGKRQHLQAILQAIHFTEYLGTTSERPTIYPFLSQPIMEFCLAVATWRWCEDGRDRSLAREGFRDLLPPSVLDRRVKGAFNQFVFQMFYRHLGTVRELLGEGLLAQQGVIDRDAAMLALADPSRLSEQAMIRLLHFVDVEAWAASC